tara:strand:- start:2400 stop:2576 length:177 start_codon:yes stop_codon:yes gene_type:complete
MAIYSNILIKNKRAFRKTNVIDLIQKVKSEEKKEKVYTVIYAVAAVSAIAVSGLIISN